MAALLFNPYPALAQQPPTPTPDAEGNIYIVVQPNDSLWSIAARAGIPLADLLALNNLTENSIIAPGDLLLIGQVEPPVTPTVAAPPPPTATKPPPPPTATAVPPLPTAICLKAFTDLNRNGVHDPGEPFKAAVAFTIFNTQSVVGNYVTDGVSEPYCLENLPPDEYKITRSVNADETLTTAGDWSVVLAQGNVVELAFGSYTAVTPAPISASPYPTTTPSPPAEESGNGRASFTFIGTLLVVIFLLASWFFYRLLNRK